MIAKFLFLLLSLRNSAWAVTIDFANAKEVAYNAITLIHTRFEMGNPQRNPFFYISANLPSWGFDIIKYKIAKKMIDAALHPDQPLNQTFLMIFGGSSVTAGHDAWYNQSYPFVVDRRLSKSLAALGIHLEVRNIAMGANSCLPYNHCYGAQGGEGADFMSWEQSFNCGKSNNIFETFARVASWNKAVAYFMASGGWSPGGCAPSNDTIPWVMENWTPELASITEKYTPNKNATQTVRNELHQYYMEGNSVGRFTAPMWPHYNGVAPHGQSVWAKGPKGTPFDFHGPCHENGGSHWMVKEMATYTAGSGAHHHPTWGMHLLRGETIAYWYLHALLDAVHTVEEDVGVGGITETLSQKYQQELDKLQTPIPAKGIHCSPDCDFPLRCFTDYEPHFNPAAKLNSLFARPPEGWVFVSNTDTRTFPASKRGFGYKDHKVFWEAVKPNSSLHLNVHIRNTTYMRVCSANTKEGLRYALFKIDPNVTQPVPVDYTVGPNAVIWKHKHVGDDCRLLENLPRGHHVLTILVNKNVTVRHRIVLTHVVMFG